MKKTLQDAKKLARDDKVPVNTGHLMLALLKGDASASSVLRALGLQENKMRIQLRQLGDEPERIWKSATAIGGSIKRDIRSLEPSALHLLISILNQNGSHAQTILSEVGINAVEARKRALLYLSHIEEQKGAAKTHGRTAPRDYRSLSRADENASFSSRRHAEQHAYTAENRVQEEFQRPHAHSGRLVPVSARSLIDMGSEIEHKQRQKRAAQFKTTPAQGLPLMAAPLKPHEAPTLSNKGFELTREAFPLLFTLGRDLVKEAVAGRLDEIVGRENEMEKIADVINRRRANSPCIVGPSGVGKTALVEGLALKIAGGTAALLNDRTIVELRPADLLSHTAMRGALSERLTQLRAEVASAEGRVILFIDEIHALLATNDGQEAIGELKTAISRGELPCIAATTSSEYARHVEADPALARRFTKIEIAEPTEAEAIEILKGVASAYMEHHQVDFTDEALVAAVKLSARYLSDRALPDKAISLMDMAGARVRRKGERAVTRDDIARVVAEQVGVPAERLTTSNQERLLNLEADLAQRIIGHRHVLCAIGETLRRNAAGFRTGRPIGSFLFLGPTGVGKTETAKALGDLLFPANQAFVRLDMSEYREAHALARLVGAPPGYIGHEEGGQLTEAVRRRPYALVLLDEIEKAHPEVLQVLLQLLDDGRLTDGMGRTVSFENTIVIMTSNLGSNLKLKPRAVGFGTTQETEAQSGIREQVLQVVRETLPPELWNRVDELLVFEPLEKKEAIEIADLMLRRIHHQLVQENAISLEIGKGLLESLCKEGGYDPEYGARPMRRTIQRLVEGPIARMILEGKVSQKETIVGTGDDKGIAFRVRREKRARSAL